MKSLIMALSLAIGSMAFAQGGTAPAAPAPAKKVSYKEAKAECKKTDNNLKGADLKKCIKDKQGK